jgi:hypothetical protein
MSAEVAVKQSAHVPDAAANSTPTQDPILLAPIARLLLTPIDAAAALGISPRLLWSKTKLGEIPCVRIGKAVRYSPTALQAWIDGTNGVK